MEDKRKIAIAIDASGSVEPDSVEVFLVNSDGALKVELPKVFRCGSGAEGVEKLAERFRHVIFVTDQFGNEGMRLKPENLEIRKII